MKGYLRSTAGLLYSQLDFVLTLSTIRLSCLRVSVCNRVEDRGRRPLVRSCCRSSLARQIGGSVGRANETATLWSARVRGGRKRAHWTGVEAPDGMQGCEQCEREALELLQMHTLGNRWGGLVEARARVRDACGARSAPSSVPSERATSGVGAAAAALEAWLPRSAGEASAECEGDWHHWRAANGCALTRVQSRDLASRRNCSGWPQSLRTIISGSALKSQQLAASGRRFSLLWPSAASLRKVLPARSAHTGRPRQVDVKGRWSTTLRAAADEWLARQQKLVLCLRRWRATSPLLSLRPAPHLAAARAASLA